MLDNVQDMKCYSECGGDTKNSGECFTPPNALGLPVGPCAGLSTGVEDGLEVGLLARLPDGTMGGVNGVAVDVGVTWVYLPAQTYAFLRRIKSKK